MEEIQRRFPDAPLFAAGYSLGSLILTKYLAEADTGKWVGEGIALFIYQSALVDMQPALPFRFVA